MTLIDIPVPGGTAEAWLSRPAGDSRDHPGVLFFMDGIGLRPQIFEMADRIADWGYVVLAPNLFHRTGTAAELEPKRDLREPGAREDFAKEFGPRIAALTPELAAADIPAYVAALRGQPGVAPSPIGVTGYCMGVRLAVRAAGALPDDVGAVGGFHGGGLVGDDPDSPHRSIPNARAEFVFGHAANDQGMPPEAIEELGRTLAEAGLVATNEVYDGPHGYTMNDTSMYDEAAADRHWAALQALFARAL